MYAWGEMLRVCNDRQRFANRRARDPSCRGIANITSVSTTKPRCSHSTHGVDRLCSPYVRHLGHEWSPVCIETSAFHRSSISKHKLTLTDDASSVLLDALPSSEPGVVVRVPAVHHHLWGGHGTADVRQGKQDCAKWTPADYVLSAYVLESFVALSHGPR